MKVLIACEFSGIVREAFRAKGHDAWSCDFLPTEIEGNHIQGDVLEVLDKGWDLMIAHPPCTYLATSGSRWLYDKRYPNRRGDQKKAIEFFMALINADIYQVAVENPVGIMSTVYRKPDQIIHPYYFGDEAQKATCLWLKNLHPLFHLDIFSKLRLHLVTNPKKGGLPALQLASLHCSPYNLSQVPMLLLSR